MSNSDMQIGKLIAEVVALNIAIQTQDTHNSKQHDTIFQYIKTTEERLTKVEIDSAGMKVFNEGLSENLSFIITNINELKGNVSADISELRRAMLMQFQKNFLNKLGQFLKEGLTPFVKTKAGFIISILITVIVLYVIFGYIIGFDKILLLIDKIKGISQ